MTVNQTLRLNGGFILSYRYRPVESAPTIVFVHGFGSSKRHFRFAFESAALEGMGLLSFDLVGFGGSAGPEDFSYGMADQAAVLLSALDRLKIERFDLCAHSMGGLVALELVEQARERVSCFVNLEGNLTPEDCFFSGKIAELSESQFATSGRQRFEKGLYQAGQKDPSMREFAEDFGRASSDALYRSAVHTVADSDAPLIERLIRIPNACYIYGEQNRGVYPGEKKLIQAGFPVFYIPGTGHSMATEKPDHLYRVVRTVVERRG